MSNVNGIKELVPVSFVMTTSGTYHTQQLRPWEFAGTGVDMKNVALHMARNGKTQLDAGLIAAVSPNMLQVGSAVAPIAIKNGWETQRGVFVLIFDVVYTVGTRVRYIVQGYTDEPAYSNKYVSPNMVFYINNVFKTTMRTTVRNGVTQRGHVLAEAFQPVNGFNAQTPGMGDRLLMRPQDVMSAIDMQHSYHNTVNIIDTSLSAAVGLQTSRVENNTPSAMLATTANTWLRAYDNSGPTAETADIASTAYQMIIEIDPASDTFLTLINRNVNAYGGMQSSFRMAQLEQAIPQVMRTFTGVAPSATGVRFTTKNEYDDLAAQNMAGQIVVNLQTMIPAIMVESLLNGVSFTLTNHGPGGSLIWTTTNVSAFDNTDGADVIHYNNFRQRIEREVVPMLALHQSTFSLNIVCSFFHEIQTTLNFNGTEVFAVEPTFSNSLKSPAQAESVKRVKDFATQMGYAVNEISDAVQDVRTNLATARVMADTGHGSVGTGFRAPPVTGTRVEPPVTPTSHHAPAAPAGGGMRGGLSGGFGNAAPSSNGGGMRGGLR